ncbi:MAG: Xaa-Pro peptidase family protein [Bacteroidetes bacterium]|nr:Xaa-Pro peptidase family protein [Bacteroidota bacterium]
MKLTIESTLVAALIGVCFLIGSETATAQGTPEQRYFDWAELPHSPAVYADRRMRMMSLLHDEGLDFLVIPGADGYSDGSTFRQTNDFLYFTGLEIPNALLVLDLINQETLIFAPGRDPRFESSSRPNDFPGRPLADDPDISRLSGIHMILPVEEFSAHLGEWVAMGNSIALNLGKSGDVGAVEKTFIMSWSPVSTLQDRIHSLYPLVKLENAFEQVAKLRMVKGPEEIATMRRVASLTAEAIKAAAGFVRDGVDERTLEAELEAVYKRNGAQRLSFASIIKSGPNSLWPWRILATHYDRRNRTMHDGELVIFDVGTELDYYISDVGRTFPVSGTFSEKQAEKLAMITAVSDAIIAAIRPGITLQELLDVAIAAIPEGERPYMQTGSFFGHHIGMSSGDPSLLDAPLEPGMIFTVEPWYYNHDEDISVFLEDVILVTQNGADVLTASLPRSPQALERMVRKH